MKQSYIICVFIHCILSFYSKQLCVPFILSFISKLKEINNAPNNTLKNGLFICSTSHKYRLLSYIYLLVSVCNMYWSMFYKSTKSFILTQLLHHWLSEGRNVSYDSSKSSIPLLIQVPNYSQIEYLSSITHYAHKNKIENYFTKPEFLTYRTYTGLSGSNWLSWDV